MGLALVSATLNINRTMSVNLIVTIKGSGLPMANASVVASWSLGSRLSGWPYSETGRTSATGSLALVSKAGRPGASVTFLVTGVTAPGYVWDGVATLEARVLL